MEELPRENDEKNNLLKTSYSIVATTHNNSCVTYENKATEADGDNFGQKLPYKLKMSAQGKCPIQTNNAAQDKVRNLRDEIVEQSDGEDNAILVDIKNGCDHQTLCENITLNLYKELDHMHVSTPSASNKSEALVFQRPEPILDLHKNCSSAMKSNQKIENNQNLQLNTYNQMHQEKAAPMPTDISANSAAEERARSPTDQNPTATKIMSEEARIAVKPEKPQKISQRQTSMFDYSTDSVYGENGALADETDPLGSGSGSLDNPSYASFDEGSSSSKSLHRPSIASKLHSLESRPIYPNVPYSPYASPYGSPRSNRRRPPLRESRRISIEQSGSFLQLNQYKLMDQIGQGSYGLVKLAYSEEDSTHYAMKILSKRRLLRQAGLMRRGPKKSTSPLDRVYREIAVLKKLDHPNVVKMVEVLDDPMEDSLYMVFELVKQGEVLSIPTDKPLSEERAWSVFRDTLLGLEYLHYQRIIHADLKPGNLLLTECGHVKIADLGVCNEFLGEDATMTNGSTAGTPAFRAPETLNIGQNVYCGKAADIWALGATLYSLVCGNVPFVANSVPVLYEKIKEETFLFPNIQQTSDELRDCVQNMLTKDPAKRITLPQLKGHAWVTAGGTYPLPSEDENCRLVQVSDDDINSVVRSIPKLDTLILIKTMLKKHSFGNPFIKGGVSGRAPQRGGSRLERFIRAGRSNSAPGSYHLAIDRQLSGDNMLPSLSELATGSTNEES